jgi:tRNA (cytidine/uridine-2'-O-)-methyltransferase
MSKKRQPIAGPAGGVAVQKHRVIPDPALHVVLHRPEIPYNTGNIARLCGAARLRLHLIHPLGFQVDDRHLRRAGLDYWQEVDVRHHESLEGFLKDTEAKGRVIAFSDRAERVYTEASVQAGDCLLFGQESTGLPPEIQRAFPCFAVPIWGSVRSLNLSTTVGIVAYHFLHRMGRF